MMTKQKLLWQKEYRRKNNNSVTKKYEKTKKGFLMRTYRNMKSRILGTLSRKAHLYKNKIILDKDKFYTWSSNNHNFNKLFDLWVKNKYDRRKTPSINRIDSSSGYEINNMEWITHSENSRLGSLSRWKMI